MEGRRNATSDYRTKVQLVWAVRMSASSQRVVIALSVFKCECYWFL